MNFQILKFILVILLLHTQPEPCFVLPHFPPVQNTSTISQFLHSQSCATLCNTWWLFFENVWYPPNQLLPGGGGRSRARWGTGCPGSEPENTCTCAVLKTKISKIPHAVIGVYVDTSQQEMRTAYKRKVMQFHPDKNLRNWAGNYK